MKTVRLKELEEMVAKLLVPTGKQRCRTATTLKETGRFRAWIAGPQRTELPRACNENSGS
jgi:hypothetical protein